jgi:hypothetical protein
MNTSKLDIEFKRINYLKKMDLFTFNNHTIFNFTNHLFFKCINQSKKVDNFIFKPGVLFLSFQ